MRTNLTKSLILAALAGTAVTSARAQSSFSMQLVADNDFAVFGGTATGANDLLYQNDYSWSAQIPNLSTMSFTLPAGDTMFYVLGLGGGGEENISGTINGVDMTWIDVTMSSDLGPYLSDYEQQNQGGQAVDQGTFNANLGDVQTAFPTLTWGAPTISYSDAVIGMAAPNGAGFHFDPSTAHLFGFTATEVGVQAAPEPSTMVLTGLGGAALCIFRRRK